MTRIVSCIFLLPAILLSGCATQAHWDAVRLREYALDYYTCQMVDNLIRASQGLPILQVNVSDLNAQAKLGATGSFNGGESVTHVGGGTFSIGSIVRTLSNTATRPLLFTAGGSIEDTIQFNTDPITDDPTAYIPYLQFLQLQSPNQRLSDVHSLHFDVNRPPVSILEDNGEQKLGPQDFIPGTRRKWHGRTFYIPIAYRQAFFDLGLMLQGSVTWSPAGRTSSGKTGKSGTGASKSRIKVLRLPPTEELMQLRQNERKINQLRSLIQ